MNNKTMKKPLDRELQDFVREQKAVPVFASQPTPLWKKKLRGSSTKAQEWKPTPVEKQKGQKKMSDYTDKE